MDEVIMELDVLEHIYEGSIKPTDLKLSALQSITGNFSEERIIGTGGFGTVYKGVLRNGGEVAVKRIKNNHTIDEKVFRREVSSLLNVSHENIVRFLGFCSHTEHKVFKNEGSRDHIYAENRERVLCFEYINNGSLENYIADELRGLQWDTRYFIIKGICEGLQYLHMEKQIIHMDLKPANILIDYDMVAKITDFGLSRMEENAQTKSTARASSPGYTAPEYIDKGEMSVKYDIYSLGIIMIELVTGYRSIPDIKNISLFHIVDVPLTDLAKIFLLHIVRRFAIPMAQRKDKKILVRLRRVLRRWRHKLHKSGKETPFRYQQIAKLIEIGLLCQDNDPYQRPFISDIISVLNVLESTDRKICNANKSTVDQMPPYSEDDMLGIEPLELRFPFKLNSHISCSLELTNETNAFIAFSVQTTSPLPYRIQPNKDIVAPRSKYSVNITLQPLDKAPQDKNTGDFIVRSTKVTESLTNEDITKDIFNRDDGKLVDEVKLTITYKGEVPQMDLSLRSLIISDTTNLNSAQDSNVPPAEAESKISASPSDEVIQLDPPELCFPLVPHKKVLSSIKITNVTDSYVSFCLANLPESIHANYKWKKFESVLQPRSTECLTVTRKETEDAVQDTQFSEEYFVYYAIVAEDIKACDLDVNDYSEYKKLPIVLTKINSCPSNELIQFDPTELSFPCLNKTSISSFNIVNITDCYVGFNIWSFINNVESNIAKPDLGVLSPLSTHRVVVKRVPKEKEPEGTQCESNLFVWNMIVAEGIEASNLDDYNSEEDSKELPSICKKISPCTTDELIRWDHPDLRFTFWQNKAALTSISMVNVTNYYVGFFLGQSVGHPAVGYSAEPDVGILAPRSTQRLVVAWLKDEEKPEDTQYVADNTFIMLSSIVSEGVKASDLENSVSWTEEQVTELPIILNKITSCSSVELINFEPPQICFPFLPSKRLLSSIKIVNTTDYHIGFNTGVEETNVALYVTEPPCGVLPPWSTQELVVTRIAKEEAPELEEMQCNDKYFVWSCFVTEDVNASDLTRYMPQTERKELPIGFNETSSNELIKFDPPELCIPLLPGQSVLSSASIVNITDQYIGFRICTKKSNSARYNTNPSGGILPPFSTQVLLVTRIAEEKELEDTQCTDKFLVWNGIVTEDVNASDVIDNMSEVKCTNLPIVLTKTSSSTSDELIQFDPPELHIPFIPNKKVSTSVKIVNLTDYNVGFNTYSRPTNAAWYHTEPPRGILPPRSTQKLMVTREEKEDALKDKQFDDKYFVWKSIVSEGVKDNYLIDYMSDQESTELPIVPDKICSSIPDELINLDPAELCIPFLLKKRMLFRVNIVNTTDFYVAFEAYYIDRNAPQYKVPREKGILPPRSTKNHIISWTTTEAELQDMECLEDFFVWNRVVTKCVESVDIISYMCEEESKKLPLIPNKASPLTSNELIQFDPPGLSLSFMPNKPLVFAVNIVNSTDYCIGFYRCNLDINAGWFFIKPDGGVMQPRSTERLVVKRLPKKKEHEDMQCEDKFYIWSSLVSEGVEVSDFDGRITYEESKKLPIAYKTSLCTSDELIQLDPPELTFPFLPNKRVSMLRKFKIVNVTDHSIGFYIWSHEDNSASYRTEPVSGILPPQSTQAIKVRRTLKEKESEDMQCKDKIFVWNGIVTEGIEVSDVLYWKNNDKELPVVLTKPGESS